MNYSSDLNYALILSRQCMWIFGIWPDPNVSLNVFRRPKIKFILITFIMSIYVFIPQLINLIRVWGNINRMAEPFVTANFSLMGLCKIIITRYHGNKLRTLIASIATDWVHSKSSWERNTMLKLTRSGRNLTFGYFIITICTVLCGYALRLGFFFRNIHQSRRYLLYRFDYIQKSPNYEITWFFQFFGATCTVFTNYSVDCFISTILFHMCAQLINLRNTLNNLINNLDNGPISSLKFRKGLAAIIKRHEHLIRSTKTIDDCYSAVLLMHLFITTLQLCFVTFQVFTIITDNADVPFIKIIYLTFYSFLVLAQLYVYCYAAERLLMESTNMVYGTYECKWYNISAKDAKDLIFIVYRSMIPLKLTAGKFGIFSLQLFGIAVKTSMGYLSALLTIRE